MRTYVRALFKQLTLALGYLRKQVIKSSCELKGSLLFTDFTCLFVSSLLHLYCLNILRYDDLRLVFCSLSQHRIGCTYIIIR